VVAGGALRPSLHPACAADASGGRAGGRAGRVIEAGTKAQWIRKHAAAEKGGRHEVRSGSAPVTGRHLPGLNGADSRCFAFSQGGLSAGFTACEVTAHGMIVTT